MRKNRTLLVLLALALLAAPALAGRADVSANLITFDSAKAQLRITGPGGYLLERNVDGAYSLSLADKKGGILADGTYSWELRPIAPAAKRGQTAPVALEAASGSFTVRNGAFVVPTTGGRYDVPTKDQVIPDDLIVQQSLCVGFDCVNGESFGFDTIRLKENNTRIKFEDTSTGTFPSTDWQLTANDSASGGSNKFSIEDITSARVPFTITGGATTNSIFVDSTGRVGFRTSTPVLDIHVNTSNTPAIRLEQNSSGGFSAQTWDIAGNEANFFVRDVTGGSKLSFRVRPGAPTSSLDIASDGDVGVGTGAPAFSIDLVRSSGSANIAVTGNDSGAFFLKDSGFGTADVKTVQALSNDGLFRLRGLTDALAQGGATGITLDLVDGDVGINCNSAADHDLVIGNGNVACTGTPRSFVDAGSTNFSTTSSRTYKENLTPVRVEGILDRISAVGVYNYDFIGGPKDRIGLMAEDFHTIFGRGSDKILSGQEMEMALWLAVQELTARNNELSARLANLDALNARLAAMEQAVTTKTATE